MMVGAVLLVLVALWRIFSSGLLASAGSGIYASSYRGGAIAGTVFLVLVAIRIFFAGRLFLGGVRHVRGTPPAASWTSRPVMAAIAVVLVLLLGGALIAAVSGGGSQAQHGWSTAPGINVHAGFLYGCRSSSAGRVNCDCIFAHLTSTPPYDTPAGFGTLAVAVDRYQQTGNPADFPVAYVHAIAGCRTAA